MSRMSANEFKAQFQRFLRGWWGRRFGPASLAFLTLLALLTQFVIPTLQTHAATIPTATISGGPGTFTNTNGVYARIGQTVTVVFTIPAADPSIKCAAIFLGSQSGPQVAISSANGPSWTFNLTVGSGKLAAQSDGVITLVAADGTSQAQGLCKSSKDSASTSFIQDTAAPAISAPPTITPAPNGANWNNSTATVKLNLTDGSGSGVATTSYTIFYNGVQSSSGTYSSSSGITVGDKGDGLYAVQYTSTDNVGNADGAPFVASVQVDATKPTIAGSQTPSPNSSGWNNTNVVVHFTCADALSGVASCTADQTLSAEGGAINVTGTATDIAGNSQTTTYGPVKIDKTAPTLSGAPTTAPNVNGWYSAPVMIHWACADALSGIAGACPTDSALSSEGLTVTASASVSDNAGNTASASSAPVKIDLTAPTTSAVAPTGWNNTSVTVNLNATDNLSGVFATYYIVDGGAQQMGTSVAFSAEGDHTLQYWSVDNAGNTETAHTIHVKIDKTPPTLIPGQTPPANSFNWNNSNVTVSFTCSDALSGVATCPASQTVTTEGAGQQVSGTATDNAGNSATAYYSVNIDKTKPTISASADRAANVNGWYNAPVTVSFTCADALSGLATSCPASQLVNEGANQSVSGSVSDMAGNSASASLSDINVDTTAPIITGAPTTAPNVNGWYSDDVTIHWTCSDNLSGVAGSCPADSLITGEGANLGVSTSVMDKAGNTGLGSVSGIKIDRTAPTTIASSAPAGWSNADVTINLSATDNLSGVAVTHYQVDGGATQTGTAVVLNTDGKHTLVFWSIDNAGNTEDKTAPGNSLTIQVDETPPTISGAASPAPNANGWNNSDVTVHFTCADATSGVAFCTPDTTVSVEGAAQSVTGSATDNAGNTALTTVGNISLDKTAPTLVGAPTTAANAQGWYNSNVTIHWTASDMLSGVDPSTQPPDVVFTGEGAGLNATASVKDYAGNATTATSQSVNIDRTPPLITGAPTTASSGTDADGNAWYKGDVTIHWTCSDPTLADPAHSAGSGVASCQADNTVSGEGAGLTTSGAATDKAGNSDTNSSDPVNIDRTAPTTTISAPNDWTNGDVIVTLSAVDNLSGVKATHYTINGGSQQTGSSFSLTSEGVYSIVYWSEDYAGNIEAQHTAQVKIDKTAPTISHGQSPAANGAGWNNTSVTVTFTCSDPNLIDGSAGSGVNTCDGTPGTTGSTSVSTQGNQQNVTGTALDNAGNSSTDTAYVSIDETPPTISGKAATPPNANGWYKAPVTINWTCSDDLSGIATCADPAVIATEGKNQTAHGAATDAAGNAADADSSPAVNIDLTPPTIGGATTTSPNANGWYNGDVTIQWTCADALSGLDGACPTSTVLTSEGSGLSATASIDDLAGNTGTATISGINIDRTPPVTSWSAAADYVSASGVKYYGEAFDVTLSATDSGSGIDQTYYILDGAKQQTGASVAVAGEGAHTLQFWSVDKAGNVEAQQSQTFLIDLTPPTIHSTRTPANAHGWNNGNVTVNFTCDDPTLADGKPGSGVQTCAGSTTVTTEGQNQSVTGNASDNVNNTSSLSVNDISIDKTKPTISGAPDRAPNAYDWYNADVTVSFTCSDALSGMDTCSPFSTLGQGKNQSVTGTALDNAGNSASTTVSGISIDETPPTLTGAATASPNHNGWYNGDVTIQWTCADALSGIAGSCPADSTVTGEGDNLSAQATVSDKADNATTTAISGIKIDRTPPKTSITAPNDWSTGAVTVTLTPTDNLSGVASTFYTINGGGMQTGDSFTLTSDGIYTIQYWSIDDAGNAETAQTAVFKIDQTAPTITHQQAPIANLAGWNKSDVTVTFTCADNLSGVKSCDGAAAPSGALTATGATTVTTEGASQAITGEAIDVAGNTASDVATLSIDKTPPTISVAPDRAPNTSGWYNAPVTETFTCGDNLSGVATCTAPVTLDQGANQSVSGTATDKAGNSASISKTGVNVDTTAPKLSGAATTAPNANGWYTGDVVIHWTCSDDLSGIAGACPIDQTLTGEGSAVTASASVSDVAGNTTTASVSVKIDRTAPVTTANYPGAIYSILYNGSVNMTLSPNDGLSGVAATHYTIDGGATQTGLSLTVSGNGKHTVTFWSVDNADNEEVHQSVAIWIDTTAPTIAGSTIPASPNGSNGWFTSPVTVHFDCADADSGVAACTANQTLPNDGANQVVNGQAIDNVGNTASASVKVNIDQTSPSLTVTVGGNTFTDGGALGSVTATHSIATPYTLGSAPKVSCAATDATAGLAAPCAGVVVGGTSNGVGSFTYTASATDKAGNQTTVSVTYQVVYSFSGFLQPINYTAHQIGASSSIFKAGSTIPFKFQLRAANGSIVQTGSSPLWIDPLAAGPTSGAPNATGSVTTSNGGAYRWDASGQQYIYNWSTSGYTADVWYRTGVKLDDGQVYLVYINLR